MKASELIKALKAIKTAGLPVVETQIAPDGTIRILHSESISDQSDQALEDWLATAQPLSRH